MSVISMGVTKEKVENFLYDEANLLDEWRLMEWAELFTEDGLYLIPPTDKRYEDHRNTLFLVADGHYKLTQRAKRLLKKEAHVEYPHARTRHMISNVRIEDIKDQVIYASCNFATYRTERQVMDTYVGQIKYQLVEKEGQLKIKEKRVLLDLDGLRPQGKVSIIL